MPIWGTPFKTKITNAGIGDGNLTKVAMVILKKIQKRKRMPEIPEILLKFGQSFLDQKLPNCSLINVHENNEYDWVFTKIKMKMIILSQLYQSP